MRGPQAIDSPGLRFHYKPGERSVTTLIRLIKDNTKSSSAQAYQEEAPVLQGGLHLGNLIRAVTGGRQTAEINDWDRIGHLGTGNVWAVLLRNHILAWWLLYASHQLLHNRCGWWLVYSSITMWTETGLRQRQLHLAYCILFLQESTTTKESKTRISKETSKKSNG